MHETPMRSPADPRHDHAIVLAGGSGSRLAAWTRDAAGGSVPKQYCSLRGGRSLLGDAIARAAAVVPRDNVTVVVAAEHERHWQAELAHVPRSHVVVQPRNRGTAPGILLPLLAVLERDPAARIAVLPSDHFVRREEVMVAALQRALHGPHVAAGGLELLGIRPERLELEYGWILPGQARRGAFTVTAFVEKPSTASALTLAAHGALWNSFVFAVRGDALLALFRQRLPELVALFTAPDARLDLDTLYAAIATADFSSEVLQGSEKHLRVQAVAECGWTDLGTPERVRECLDSLQPVRRPVAAHAADLERMLGRSGSPVLARQHGGAL